MRILYRMSNERERVICVTLSEAEWQAFIARQPQPVLWLREQIRAEAGMHGAAAGADRGVTRSAEPRARAPGERRRATLQPSVSGNTISKTVRPGRLVTDIVPPCRSTIAFTIDNPSPLPPLTPARDASAL